MDFNKLIARVKNILLTPKTEWPLIAAEPDTVAGLFTNYILILAAIPAIVVFLLYGVIGISLGLITFRFGFGPSLTYAVSQYVAALLTCYLMMFIIDALAPTFGGEKDPVQSLKSIAYANTAGWVASILGIVSALGLLAMLAGAIYSIYLLYLGLPYTKKCPQDKAGGYAAVTIVIGIVIVWIFGAIIGTATGLNTAIAGVMLGSLPR